MNLGLFPPGKAQSRKVWVEMKKGSASKYVFLIPGFAFFSFALLIPFLMGIHIAFTDWNGVSREYNIVGLKNFVTMLSDKRLYLPIRNTFLFAVLGTIGNNALSLMLAILINAKTGHMGKLARLIFFVPVCFSTILTAFLWKFIFGEVFMDVFSIKNLLGSKLTVIPAIVIMGLWNGAGIHMLIYLSGLKNISQDYYEAAVMDGASAFQKFKNITLPLLMPSFTVCITLTVTGWLKEFSTTMAATNAGPAGTSRTISIYIYENLYSYHKAGYGQAVSLVFLIALAAIGLGLSSFFRKREVEL